MKVNKFMAMTLSMSLMLCACAEKQSANEVSEEPSTEPVTEEITEPTEPPAPEKTVAEEILENMDLRQKVCQMFITTPEQVSGWDVVTLYDETVEDSIINYPIGGLIMFSENLETTEQTTELISNIQECSLANSGIGMFMSVDEEGGTIARVADSLGTASFDDMSVYGEQNDTHVSYEIGYTIGSELKALGFNLDFAPVADVNISDASELGGRIFSSDSEVVANMASNVAIGLKDAGVYATLKHFPGLGAADGNTHTDSSVIIERSVDDLRETDFIPFKAGIESGTDFVMVGHQVITGVGDWLPSDLSYTVVTELLRQELGFDGVIITDSHMMSTITEVYTSAEAAVLAVNAGVDMILMPVDLDEAINAICQAVENGDIESSRIDESVLRILTKKYEMGLIDESFRIEDTTETTTDVVEDTVEEETTTTTTVTTTTEIPEETVPVETSSVTTTFAGYVAGTFVDPNTTTTTTTAVYDYYDYNYDYNYGYYDYGYDYGYYDYTYDYGYYGY